ncbi:MAG: diheme cytochrome c [Burkholderiaceae bacterium]
MRSVLRNALLMMAGCAALAAAASADEHEHRARVPMLKAYAQECSGCHIAFPPRMLPAASWQRVMAGLATHYGSDASLDTATVNQISVWLNANAGTGRRVREAPPEDRITRSDWFLRKHHEVAPGVFLRPSIRSAANCAACHAGAERGDYDDDGVRIPR